MFIVIGIMLVGVLVGYMLQQQEWLQHIGKVITTLIWLLLFLLGIEVGGDERIIKGIHTLGIEAFVLTLGGLAGSVFCAWMLWRYIAKKGTKA